MEIIKESRQWTTNYEVIPSSYTPAKESCIKCSACNNCLAGQHPLLQNGKTYCWQCYTRIFAFTCVSCSKVVSGGSEVAFIVYNKQVWHHDCFRCSVCKKSVLGGKLTQTGKQLYCGKCKK